MDNQQTVQILDLLHTLQEGSLALHAAAANNNITQFQLLAGDIEEGLNSILFISGKTDTTGNRILHMACQSVLDSLHRIWGFFFRSKLEDCLKKIEFELLPLIQEAYHNCYFFQYLQEHPEKLSDYYSKDIYSLGANSYIEDSIAAGHYKYDVSIIVLAYNKLDYTKQCVESLLNNLPAGLNYELILINHGSSDGTKEYFESIHPHKQLDIAVNQGGLGAMGRIVEGEFSIQISNDVIITPCVIENLLACIRSDHQIGWVVPTTSSISNLQTIPASYNNLDEMMEFSRHNNCSDPFRWERRVRLCNPVHIIRNTPELICHAWHYHTLNAAYYNSFPDDRLSLLLRRSGYKLMLAKDAYCHHFGSVTLKDEVRQQNEQKYYLEGRRHFYQAFGVDPWGTGFCFDPVFLDRVVGEEHGHTEILGINCGLGSNSLKIKEQLKEYCHNVDTRLCNITDDASFLADLKGISDEADIISTIKKFKEFGQGRTYQYIVWETPFLTSYKFKTVLSCCLEMLAPAGKLLIKLTNQSRAHIPQRFPTRKELGNEWVLCEKEGGA